MIMGIAVVGLLSNISTSLQHASRLTDYDRAALVARRTMDELLLDSRLPYDSPLEGQFDPAATGMKGGWRARLTRFEAPPQTTPGTPLLERLELEVWWERAAAAHHHAGGVPAGSDLASGGGVAMPRRAGVTLLELLLAVSLLGLLSAGILTALRVA